MTDDDYTRRKNLTFLQAEGREALPTQMKLDEVSDLLRNRTWAILYRSFQYYMKKNKLHYNISMPWTEIYADYCVHRLNLSIDSIKFKLEYVCSKIKPAIFKVDSYGFYDFVQWIVRHRHTPDSVVASLAAVLLEERAGFRLVNNDTLMPVVSEMEADTLKDSLECIREARAAGADTHFANAIREVSAGRWADSVRESVHAVESVARNIAPEAKTLGEALAKLGQNGFNINPALKKGFSSIYGYTNGEQGIRHAILDGSASNVDEIDALYMLGACASFVTYLLRRANAR